MPNEDFLELASNLDEITRWCLSEIVYCLEKYHDMSKEEAYILVVSSEYLKTLLKYDALFLQSESAFGWAMTIMHKSFWWHNEAMQSQYREYIQERRRPPSDQLEKD